MASNNALFGIDLFKPVNVMGSSSGIIGGDFSATGKGQRGPAMERLYIKLNSFIIDQLEAQPDRGHTDRDLYKALAPGVCDFEQFKGVLADGVKAGLFIVSGTDSDFGDLKYSAAPAG